MCAFNANVWMPVVQVRVEFGGCVSAKRVVAFAAGGLMLGMGMTISGAVSLTTCSLTCLYISYS